MKRQICFLLAVLLCLCSLSVAAAGITVSGDPVEGSLLTAQGGAEGGSYQWQRLESLPDLEADSVSFYEIKSMTQGEFAGTAVNRERWTDLPGAVGATYTPTAADKQVRVVYTAPDGTKSISDPMEIIALADRVMTYYIAPNGKDTNNGSKDAPFATLEAARDAIRAQRQTEAGKKKQAVVYLRGGVYRRTQPFTLTGADAAGESTVYRNYPGEEPILSGVQTVSLSGFTAAAGEAAEALPTQDARLHVIAGRVENFPSVTVDDPYYWCRLSAPILEQGGSAMRLARYPNVDEMLAWPTSTTVTSGRNSASTGEKMKIQYNDPTGFVDSLTYRTEDILYGGFYSYGWQYEAVRGVLNREDKTITALDDTKAGSESVQTKGQFQVHNTLQALDEPGEWYYDRDQKLLYLYPYDRGGELTVPGADFTLLRLDGVSNTTFSGISLQGSRESAVTMKNCENTVLDGCKIHQIEKRAVLMNGVKNCGVRNSELYNLGCGAVEITNAGDYDSIGHSGVFVSNNTIHDFGLQQMIYADAVRLDYYTVGCRIDHNEIYNAYHEAILAQGVDQIIENNVFHDLCTNCTDAGVVYGGRDYSSHNIVIRNNWFYRINTNEIAGKYEGCAIFFDDGQSDVSAYGNIFGPGSARGTMIKVHGGQNLDFTHNLFVDTPNACAFYLWGDAAFKANLTVTDPTNVRYIRLRKCWDNPLYQARWPWLKEVYEGVYDQKGCTFSNNILLYDEETSPGNTGWYHLLHSVDPVYGINQSEGNTNRVISAGVEEICLDPAANDWRLKEETLASMPGFSQLPSPDELGPAPYDRDGAMTLPGGERPSVSQVRFSQPPAAGGTVSAIYDFFGGTEGASRYEYYVYDSAAATSGTLLSTYTTRNSCSIPEKYRGRWIRCRVIPVNSSGLMGQDGWSEAVEIGGTAQADKTALVEQLAKARAALQSAVAGTQDGQYPQSAIDQLKAGVDRAQTVADDPDALQFQVDEAVEQLSQLQKSFADSQVVAMERMSIGAMLQDTEHWQSYTGTEPFTLEQGVLTLTGGTGAAYTGAQYQNKIFVFKMKLETAVADQKTLNCSVCFRAQNPALLWNQGNGGYLWWMKREQNEAQLFQPNILRSFTQGLIEPGREYTVGVGVYDTAGGGVRLKLFLDDLTTPVYDTVFTDDHNLYGESGYFMAASGAGVTMRLWAVDPADQTVLTKVLTQAEELLQNAQEGDGYGAYSTTVTAAFRQAIDRAKGVNRDGAAVQATVDEAVASLQNAMKTFRAGVNTHAVVTENGKATLLYGYPQASFAMKEGVTSFTVEMDPVQEQPRLLATLETAQGTVQMESQSGAKITGNGWTGDFLLPAVGSTPSGTVNGTGLTVTTLGGGAQLLTSSKPVRLVLPGQGDKLLAVKQADGTYRIINKRTNLSEDSFAAAEAALPQGGTVKLVSGEDMIVYTTLLGELVTYDFSSPTPTPSETPDHNTGGGEILPPSPGSGGGGSIGGGSESTSDQPLNQSFRDMAGHWAAEAVAALAKRGIVTGVTEMTFEPDREITRAEFATLAVKALNLKSNISAGFTDVPEGAWYAPFVNAAANAGLISGYAGAFRPEEPITREEMAVVVMKAYALRGGKAEAGGLEQFRDRGEISDWAAGSVAQAVKAGVIFGTTDDTFAPQENATRAQAAGMLWRMLQKN